MKIVVFGGAGFLGSHVADALSDAGHEVTVFDINKSAYLRSDQTMVVGDILDDRLVAEMVSQHQIVYHLAGIADIDECVYRPVDTVKYNILGTVQLLEACRKSKIERFVFASSVYVYSDSGYFYRTSKRACEEFIENYRELHGLKYTILRYGSLYGERSDERNSIYRLINQAIAEGEIVYKGTGNELREYIHVHDAALSSVEILSPEFENQNIILSGNQVIKYSELLEMICEMLGNRIKIKITPAERKAHYKITPYNFSPKLGKKLVINPHIDMGQGLLACMAEIYEKIHNKKDDNFGMFIERSL